MQRSQLEALIQSVARSRDDNLVADIEATLRAALQQAALTGSAEPLVAALKQIDDRLARADQPRLEPVRRAIARDLDRVKAASVADVASLSIKLDEAVRMVDELPLLSAAERATAAGRAAPRPRRGRAPARRRARGERLRRWPSNGASRPGSVVSARGTALQRAVLRRAAQAVRVTRIDQPEAMLIAPDQAFFLRENLKLRLLNARLSLLARQFDARAGRPAAGRSRAIERYFDRSVAPRSPSDLIAQVAQQARQVGSRGPTTRSPRSPPSPGR